MKYFSRTWRVAHIVLVRKLRKRKGLEGVLQTDLALADHPEGNRKDRFRQNDRAYGRCGSITKQTNGVLMTARHQSGGG